MFRTWLHETLSRRYPGLSFDVLVPPDAAMGDYSTNIAMVARKDPKEICDVLKVAGEGMIARCDVAGPGFINIFLSDDYLRDQLGKSEIPNEGGGKKVIVDYSSPNIAKPMHVGHLRSTVIGAALANIYQALGYEVIRWNYIGDWGTQFGKLIAAYKKWGGATDIASLVQLYVRANKELDEQEGRAEFKKLEEGDPENKKLWNEFRVASLVAFDKTYDQLGVHFDITKGESDYEKELPALIGELMAKGLAKESEGALIVPLGEKTPGMLRKSDGATIYLTRDIATLRDRINKYHPSKILYVVANQQALHFEQLFAIKQMLGLETEAVHVKFGMVLGPDGKKFSTREGNAVPLQEVLDEAVKRAKGSAIAIGALKYNDLKQNPHTDITFDWDAMLDLGGNSGPYLQYTYARLGSIVEKVGDAGQADLATLEHPAERGLMRHMLDFGWAVSQCAALNALNGLALYLYELAEKSNRFYEQVRINDDDNLGRKAARLELVRAVRNQLKQGLGFLGIQPLERI